MLDESKNKIKQKLWDFQLKKKRNGINPKTLEKIIMFLISIVGVGVALYFLIQLITFLLQ